MWNWLRGKGNASPPPRGGSAGALPRDLEGRLQSAMLCQRAIALVEAGRREEALGLFQQAVMADPGYALAWSDLGICLNELGRHAEALDALAKACQTAPHDFATWVHRAKACAALGRREEAREHLKQARRLGSGKALEELERQLR